MKASSQTVGYDSLTNFLGDKPHPYIGEVLYLKGKPAFQRNEGYENFVIDYKIDKLKKDNVYQCCDYYNAKYDALHGHSFKVTAVLPHPKAVSKPYPYASLFFLQLQDVVNNQTCYYEYDTKLASKFPFTVVGYYEKIKNNSIGNNYVFKNAEVRKLTGKNPQPGELWKCTDMIIENEENKIAMKFANGAGISFTVPYDEVAGTYNAAEAFTETAAAGYKQRFGNENWNALLYNQLKNGMSEEMCRVAWGEPNRTNNLSDGTEQWVYETRYLYFKGGKLTRVQ
ncbi:MAG: hypothetical protein EOP51_31110 [Sphingobacteriales bacterium]|nr:MAG: hypothetical protein EOP51_31110 [Sphingobacteriales bacterium]